MKNYCFRFALCLLLAIQVTPAQAQGVEMSITKTIDILAGRPRPLLGQTNYQLQTAFNTSDGGYLSLAPDSAGATLLSRFTPDGALLRSRGAGLHDRRSRTHRPRRPRPMNEPFLESVRQSFALKDRYSTQ